MKLFIKYGMAIFIISFALAIFTNTTFADGTETLGPPENIKIASGSGMVVSGIGLLDHNSGEIEIDVPGEIKQALLYWICESDDGSGGDTIQVNMQTVNGTSIGGSTKLGTVELWTETFRSDITAMVEPGENSLIIEGNDCLRSTGSGLLVIYDDGSRDTYFQIRDGNDFAFCRFMGNLNETVPQSFYFPKDTIERSANLFLMVSSIEAQNPPDILRRNSIEITIDGVTEVISNALIDNNGSEWDTFIYPVTIPAGASLLTVQLFSRDDDKPGTCAPYPDPNRPASLVWVGTGLSIEKKPHNGCTPGYWKQEQHYSSWSDYRPSDTFVSAFGFPIKILWSDKGKPQIVTDPTLLKALEAKGGDINALARHAVAGLLNAANPVSNYPRNEAQVVDMVKGALLNPATIEEVKDTLANWNELGCSLNGSESDLPSNQTDGDMRFSQAESLSTAGTIGKSSGSGGCYISSLF